MRRVASALLLCAALCAARGAEAGWTRAVPLSRARADAGAVALDGRIYVAGGLSLTGTSRGFEAFDPARGEWRALAPLPEPLHHARLAGAAGRVLAIGGYTDLCRSATRAAWSYDPAGDVWSPIEPLPELRGEHALVALGERVYVLGGRGHLSDRPWRYAPARRRWEILPAPMDTPRYLAAAAALGERIYVIGGRAAQLGDLASVEVFDPASESWSRAADLPEARAGLAAAVVDGRIHVAGGEIMASSAVFSDHWIYDPAADAWSAGAPLSLARRGQAAAALPDGLYLIGGSTGTGLLGALLGASGEVEHLERTP
jgi:N-acetylneuraminic acid mutarotase